MNNPLLGDNSALLEELYQRFLKDPSAVDGEWARFFRGLENGGMPRAVTAASSERSGETLEEMGIINLMNSYRNNGHLAAKLDPLGMRPINRSLIDGKLRNFSEADLNAVHDSGIPALGRVPLRRIIEWMETTYCRTIGAEHKYLVNEEERIWIESRMEETANNWPLSTWEKLRIFDKIVHADYFEQFLAKKYVGKKRFSMEGGETLISMLDTIIEMAGEKKMSGIVIGMAHRGRLNVLVNTIEKPAGLIFAEFEENFSSGTLDYADVKYHLGYSNARMTSSGHEVHLSLMFNPSHLEAVNPVVVGSVRARQTKTGDVNREKFLGIMIHGDAAFPGQGVVAETLNLMNVEGFTTGGSIHLVVNNQIGFTTLPDESRSTLYATDLAKGFQIPIFHVNGDDPIAAFRIMKLAMEYRARFKKDVIIDLVCYRRLGHNETDEPAFTQPQMYDIIRKHPRTAVLLERELLTHSDISQTDLDFIKNGAQHGLEESFRQAHEKNIQMQVDTLRGEWSKYEMDLASEPATRLLKKQISQVSKALTRIPEGFTPHPKLVKLLETRHEMYENNAPVDWGAAEALAFGSILAGGHNIRLCGQDSQRGTFSHRHAVLVDIKTGEKWVPLNKISADQGVLEVINSPLSEFSVLGFEYGYSLTAPSTLTLWEAQFGDFANGAQIIFDQFLTSSQVKWHRFSGLVVLLPHGYEGQGPEHSSARLERFLQMCADDNIYVCNCTTGAQYFHLLRRQILRSMRKPLIIMSPKSLLRSSEAASPLEELNRGVFREVLPDTAELKEDKVRRLVLCSGKVYYDLARHRTEQKEDSTAIVRVEQLYPFPDTQIRRIVRKYRKLKEVVWVQEEPVNMGAWFFMEGRLRACIGDLDLRVAARRESASPAAGMHKLHASEQIALVSKAFNRHSTQQ